MDARRESEPTPTKNRTTVERKSERELARISHTTECFCEVPWYFSGRQGLGMRDGGGKCRCERSDIFGSPWASG